MSKIEWTEQTWNPTTGCNKVSPGCKNCYAEVFAKRLQEMGVKGYEKGFKLTLHKDRLTTPISKRKPTLYFVNSMSDLFHEDVPFAFIDKVIDTITQTKRHVYQILTKRPERMKKYFDTRKVPANAWVGTSVEDIKYGLPRIDILRDIDCKTKFLSCEPLLEDLGEFNLAGIQWVIVGGESGRKARPMKGEWAINIQVQCAKQNIPFFFKQWGAYGEDGKKRSKKENGRILKQTTWNHTPKQMVFAH